MKKCKKILLIVMLFMMIVCYKTTNVFAKESEVVLPEYESNITDSSELDPNFEVTENSLYVEYERAPKNTKPNVTINNINTNTRASYQNIYSKDSYEDNNSKGDAANLGTLYSEYALGMSIGGTIHDIGSEYATNRDDRDVDYYKFTIDEPYKYTITLSDIPSGCDYDIKLYEKGKTWIFFNKYTLIDASSAASNQSEVLDLYNNEDTEESYNYLPEGTYVIEIYSYSGCSSSTYDLHIVFWGLDDEYEVNDTKEEAYLYPLSSSPSYSSSLQATIDRNDDEDWYKIIPQSYNSKISINLHSPASNYKYTLELYKDNEHITEKYTSNVIDDDYTNLQLIYGSTYYIRIYCKNEATHSTNFKYTLTMSGTNSNSVYSYKTNGQWNQYGIKWTYDQEASTSNGYTAKKYYSLNESYLYMTEKIYLYNFNVTELWNIIGTYNGLIIMLDENPNFLVNLSVGVITAVGSAATSYIMKGIVPNTALLVLTLSNTTYKIISEETLSQYYKNVYNYMMDNLENVANNTDRYRIEIEIYNRAGSTDKYVYVRFINDNDIYAPEFFEDTIYTDKIVYGNLSYLTKTQNTNYVNEYLFDARHDYKNNFQ